MDTNYKAHVGHTVKLDEYVEQNWELRWEDGEPRRVQVTDETVLDNPDPRMYCFICDLYLTGFDVSVI
jgi:hypothetical protein